MQTEVRIVIWNPTMDTTKFAADVYATRPNEREKRVHCGRGGQTAREAMAEAVEFITNGQVATA